MKKYFLHNKMTFWVLVLLQAVQAAFMVGFALVLQYGVNLVSSGVSVYRFMMFFLFMVGYIAVLAAVMFVFYAVSSRYVNNCVDKLRTEFSDKLVKLPFWEFSKNDSAKYISNLTNDMKTISVNYFQSLLTVPYEIFCFIFSVGAAFYINWIAALTLLGLTLLILLVPVIFNKPLNKANLAFSESIKQFTRIVKETFLGIDVIKNFNSEEKISKEIESYSKKLAKKNIVVDRLTAFSQGTGMLIVVILQVGAIAIAGYLVLTEAILIGALIGIMQLGNNLFMPIVNLANKSTLAAGVKDLNELITDVVSFEKPEATESLASLNDAITVNNLSFSFEEDQPVLQDVSLRFEKGKKYLLAGKSGSGKSTVLKLISKMRVGFTGDILFDNIDINNLDDKEINEYISFAQQKSYLFNRSVKDNIDFNSTNDSDKLERVIKLSCLDEFVSRQEDGLNTVIDEEVNQVSGGEKLRIGLARALYKDAEVLLLDEITSALDKETAFNVEKNILSLKDKTVVSVSHKIHEELLENYDKIGILEGGRLVMFKPPADALKAPEFAKYISESK